MWIESETRLFLHKKLPSHLTRSPFAVRYFSFFEQIVLLVFLDSSFVNYLLSLQYKFSLFCTYLPLNRSGMILLLIFLSKLSLLRDIDRISEWIYPNETLCKFLTAMMWCLRFIWIANSSDHRRVLTANLLTFLA